MTKRLPILCPQVYGYEPMCTEMCTRASCSNWDRSAARCTVETGAEDFRKVDAKRVPTCPIQERCQHQIQAGNDPCVVRRGGLICESALVLGGMTQDAAHDHPLSFNADYL